MTKLYAIIDKNNGSIQITRPYTTLGRARAGFSHVNDEDKKDLAIAEFSFDKIVMDGKDLFQKQSEARKKKEEKAEKSRLEWRKKDAERRLKKALEGLENLTNGK